jgi:hypothetical protein
VSIGEGVEETVGLKEFGGKSGCLPVLSKDDRRLCIEHSPI